MKAARDQLYVVGKEFKIMISIFKDSSVNEFSRYSGGKRSPKLSDAFLLKFSLFFRKKLVKLLAHTYACRSLITSGIITAQNKNVHLQKIILLSPLIIIESGNWKVTC